MKTGTKSSLIENLLTYIWAGTCGLFVIFLILIPYGIGFHNKHSKIDADTAMYKGHTMIVFQKGTSVSIIHAPECKKCYQIYD